MHIFDRLVDRDGMAWPYVPLAESSRVINDTLCEIKLRQGVTWHDGRPFAADDVVFTFGRVLDAEQPQRLRWISPGDCMD